MNELNENQKIFCAEYIKDRNGSRAYSVAYNRENDETSRVNASELLTNTNVKEYITRLLKPLHEKLGITAKYILKGIKNIAESADRYTKEGDAVPDFKTRLDAFNSLAKYKELALFVEKIETEHTGEITLKLEPEIIEYINNVNEKTTDSINTTKK